MALQKLIRTALYIRVSTEEQALHGLSLEAQEAALTEYCEKNGLYIVGKYVDEGITARKKMSNRKALLRLLEDVKAGKIDQIIFTKIDRWMRNIYDYHKVQEVLEQYNVNWKTIFENYDTSTSSGRLHINIMLSVAQDEADRTSERIKAVFDNKIKNKEYPAHNVPFGYVVENCKVLKDGEVQHIVEDLFREFFENHSMYSTQTYLLERYGITLTNNSFRSIFNSTLYFGEYRGVKDFCEPYLTKEQYEEIRNIIQSKNIKRGKTGRVYVFAGLLRCPECGNRLSGKSMRHETKSGIKEYKCYKCMNTEASRRCNHKTSVGENLIEKYLLKNVASKLDEYERECQIKAAEVKPKKSVAKEIEKTKNRLSRLKDLYLDNKVQMDDYEKEYDELVTKLNQLRAEEAEENEKQEQIVDIEAIKNLLSKSTEEIYQTLTAENRRKFWSGFIDHVVVHSRDSMDIFFK